MCGFIHRADPGWESQKGTKGQRCMESGKWEKGWVGVGSHQAAMVGKATSRSTLGKAPMGGGRFWKLSSGTSSTGSAVERNPHQGLFFGGLCYKLREEVPILRNGEDRAEVGEAG